MCEAGGYGMLVGIEKISAGVDEVLASPGWSLSDEQAREVVARLDREQRRLEAARLHAVKVLDDRGDALGGAGKGRVAVTFLMGATNADHATAAADVRVAQAIDADTGSLPEVGAALAAGEISREHVDIAVKAVATLPKECLNRVLPQDDGTTITGGQYVDRWLADNARTNKPKTLNSMAKALRAYLDPDSVDAGYDPDGHLKRSVTIRRDPSTGMATLHAVLTAPDAAVLQAYLKNAARPTPPTQVEQQQADGSTQLVLVEDQRWAGQRRYDALMPAVRAALTRAGLAPTDDADTATGQTPSSGEAAAADESASPGAARPARDSMAPTPAGPAVTLLVTATVEQVAAAGSSKCSTGDRASQGTGCATLDGAGPVSPAMLEYLSCTATVQKVLLSPNGVPLELGRKTRFASPAQRTAALLRDNGCVIPGCDCPFIDLHHVIHWAAGGPTDLNNLVSLCSRHHTEVHLGTWVVKILDGEVWLKPPDWIDPERRWIRSPRRTNDDAVRRAAEQLTLPIDGPRPDGLPIDPAA